MKTIIILGGSGYIGQHLMLGWNNRRDDLSFVSVSRRGAPKETLPGLKDARIKWVSGDVTDPSSFVSSLPGHPDAVIDLVGTASGKSQDDFDRMNAQPVETMVSIMKKLGVAKGAYVSGLVGMPGSDKMFRASKAKGEKIAADSGLDIFIVRPSLVYGQRKGVGAMVLAMKLASLFCPKMRPVKVDTLVGQIIDGVDV